MKIIIDTNVIMSALRSKRGYSFRLLDSLSQKLFRTVVSVALVLEYEDVLKRPGKLPHLETQDIDDIINYFISISARIKVHYKWRPFLKDPGDDMLVELAVAAEAFAIITFNKRDFAGTEKIFGIQILDPKEFLQKIGERS